MTLKDSERNRKMVRNYLSLAHRIPIFRLTRQRNLDQMGVALDRLESHLRELSSDETALGASGEPLFHPRAGSLSADMRESTAALGN